MYTIYFARNEDGVWTNLERKYAEHACAFDWGRECDEAADLALNVLQWALETGGYRDRHLVEVNEGGCVYGYAYVLYKDFMRQVIVHMPYEGGELSLFEITDWLDQYPQLR
jgi:hypothetical protein